MANHSNQEQLQYALFQAAKVGHIKLMRELIFVGANPFKPDEQNRSAIVYAHMANPEELVGLLKELDSFETNRWMVA